MCFGILFGACSADLNKESKNIQIEPNKTLEAEKVKEIEEIETPLQKELKKNLKSHLDSLSQELRSQNLGGLRFENTGAKEHFLEFENLGRKNFQRESGFKVDSTNKTNLILDKAYTLQEERIQKLRQKNDEIGE